MILCIGGGETVHCPHCEEEFDILHTDAEDWDDMDQFFYHVTNCEGNANE